MKPYVTVLMPVYNGEDYLQEAIDSILNQTFRNFELIIIDDGSTDETAAILSRYAMMDSRIMVVANENNIGIPGSLNRGLALARGKYIARMDADDISLPMRLEKQVQYMDNNPEIGVCGGWYKTFGDVKPAIIVLPEKHDDIFAAMLFGNKIANGTVMIRKMKVLKLDQFYNIEFKFAEDYEYWARLMTLGVKFTNIGKVLFNYRIHQKQATQTNIQANKHYLDSVRIMLLKKLGFDNAENKLILHNLLAQSTPSGKESIRKIATWIDDIVAANKKKKIFTEASLLRELAQRWFKLCYRSSNNGLLTWKIYHRHTISKSVTISPELRIKFLMKCLLSINSRYDLKKKWFFG